MEQIIHQGTLLAIIVRRDFQRQGTTFFTPEHLSQQLGFLHHPAGHVIEPHVHLPASREVLFTQEVLFLRRGRLQVDFYDAGQRYLRSEVLEAGDVILLAAGGHGFTVLEEVEMFEVKQGPYGGDEEKRRFVPGSAEGAGGAGPEGGSPCGSR
ncbi:MAG: hypothetical protein AB1568_13925 [Thermodesulfobacteriota bacterium]